MLARGAVWAQALIAACAPLELAAQKRIPIDIGDKGRSAIERGETSLDLLEPPPTREDPTEAQIKECEDARDASALSGEIVVCRKLPVDNLDRFAVSREAWLEQYANETMNAGTILAPDVDNTQHPFAGIGASVTITGCFIPPCPPPQPILIDVEGLPPPPSGSDAHRIARGLAPTGSRGEPSKRVRESLEAELALPPAPDFETNAPGEEDE